MRTARLMTFLLGASLTAVGMTSTAAHAATVDLAPAQVITRSGVPAIQAGPVALDPTGRVVALDAVNDRIDVYAADATGSSAPLRTIAGSNTGLSDGSVAFLASVAVDRLGRIYVNEAINTSETRLLVFAADASGNVAPIRSVTSPLGYPEGLAVDADFNTYIGMDDAPNNSQIAVFGPDQSGSSVPIRRIGTAYPTMDTEYLAVDRDGNVYVSYLDHSVLEFAADASSTAAPIRTIETTLQPEGITVDDAGRLYIGFSSADDSSISVYSPSASGLDPTPITTIQGPSTTMGYIGTLAWRCDGTLFVSNYGGDDLLGFDTGLTAPPVVTSVAPSAGAQGGGTKITLTGSAFVPEATVTVGGTACTQVTFINSGRLTCVTGAHAAGQVAVTCTTCGRSGTLAKGFTYQATPPPPPPPTPETTLTVSATTRAAPVGHKHTLVKRVTTNGTVRGVTTQCRLHGTKVRGKDARRLCGIEVSRGGPAKVRVTAAPDCTQGLLMTVRITARKAGSTKETWQGTWRATSPHPVQCHLKGTG